MSLTVLGAKRAIDLFEERDAFAARLQEIDAKLALEHGEFMRAERLWGLRLEGFRRAVQQIKDAQ